MSPAGNGQHNTQVSCCSDCVLYPPMYKDQEIAFILHTKNDANHTEKQVIYDNPKFLASKTTKYFVYQPTVNKCNQQCLLTI